MREIEDQVEQYGGDRLETTGDRSVLGTLALVESHFADVLASAPRETTAAGRGRLARYANEALVRQYEGFFARPWARGDAGDSVVDFDCECGSAQCVRQVPLRRADFPGGPLLAPGHPAPAG
ncbi:hypothetical protein GCM10010232_37070 [Streptomyces amakusaensis]|uniref:Post-SET domain-containing protein n=1 Tax=Streptomyces amakusaensis TaxID=67271 RepID=A0ABW0AF93_9ACTN